MVELSKREEERALEIHRKAVVVEPHSDIPIYVVPRRREGERAVFKQHYLPSFKRGGVDVIIFIAAGDAKYAVNWSDRPLKGALEMVDGMLLDLEESKDDVSLVTDFAGIEKAVKQCKTAGLLGFEGSAPFEDSLSLLRNFWRLGIRSMVLTWSKRNLVADGTGEPRTDGHLTDFGMEVVREMNRLGMIVDLAHLKEAGFFDVLEITRDPVICSHANCRSICNHTRNLTDEMIKALAEKGGVQGVMFLPSVVDLKKPSLEKILDHIDHVVNLVGVDHVGLGSDFILFGEDDTSNKTFQDMCKYVSTSGIGLGNMYPFPEGAEDVSKLPNVTRGLVSRGYSDQDIEKILGLNFLNVFKRVLK